VKPKRRRPKGNPKNEGRHISTNAKEVAKAELKNQILELRVAGLSFRQIAKALDRKGLGYVHALAWAAIDEIPRENAKRAKALELERLDGLWRASYPLAVGMPKAPPAGSPPGTPPTPRDPDMIAQRQCIRISALRSRIDGTLAPTVGVEKHLHAFAGASSFERWTEDDMRVYAETGKLPRFERQEDE
jgi:hypothetical protein